MGPVRGNNKKKRKAEEQSAVFGSTKVGCDEWWDVISKKIAGHPSSSQGLDNFKSTFNMSKKTFGYICSLVQEHIMAKTHFVFTNGKPLSLNDQVALALRRLGSGNSLISIGDSFNTHHSTVSQVTWRFVEAIESKGLHHLQWPTTENERTKIKTKFEKIQGFPNCCGAIDTTHIIMQLTSSDPESEAWLDRSERHSMTLQAIVDPSFRFRDVVAGWPGKMHDASVLQSSSFFRQCLRGEKLNGGNRKHLSDEETESIREYIVGDVGFPLLPWLVTPYQGKKLPEAQLVFNKRLDDTHSIARKALVRLKEDWKMIKGEMWRPDKHKLPRIILVCCILHNIVIDMEKNGDHDDDGDGAFDESSLTQQHDPGYEGETCESVEKEGLILRDKLCVYFSGR